MPYPGSWQLHLLLPDMFKPCDDFKWRPPPHLLPHWCPARVLLLGGPGSGKGTQCTKLADHFGLPYQLVKSKFPGGQPHKTLPPRPFSRC